MNLLKTASLRAGFVLALIAASTPAATQEPNSETQTRSGPWHTAAEQTDDGHIIGNPEAETLLSEFVSYTCGHCATFTKQGDPVLDIAFISPGKLRFEIRPYIRNALDLTISMLAACGAPEKFKGNHTMFMRSQGDWLPRAAGAPQSQQAIWGRGDRAARANMSSALGLTDKMIKQRGYSAIEVDTCLADDAMAQKLMQNTIHDAEEFGIQGTPSFAIDGELQKDVHEWRSLEPILVAHIKSKTDADKEPKLGESHFD